MVLFLFEKVCYNESSLKMWKKDCAYESLSENKKTVDDIVSDVQAKGDEIIGKIQNMIDQKRSENNA